jgi:hypothetical protein
MTTPIPYHPDTPIAPGELWRHVKRGTVYGILAVSARCQVSSVEAKPVQQFLEGAEWVAYSDGVALYFRMRDEFLSGRFELVLPEKSPP